MKTKEMSYLYNGFVFNKDGFAIALDKDQRPIQVNAKPGSLLPRGFSICRIAVNGKVAVAEYLRSSEEPSNTGRFSLKALWATAYSLHQWTRNAQKQSFVSLDLESDGAEIWEAALIFSDETENFVASSGTTLLDDLQQKLDEHILTHILVGHNIRQWDLTILQRYGVRMPSGFNVWDTLEQELELCKDRPRPSYALQTAHHAELDAQIGLELAQNQWLRKNAPAAIAESAWGESNQFFITPDPVWAKVVPDLDTNKCSWQKLEEAYRSADLKSLIKVSGGVTWSGFPPPRAENALSPFNPASPKRVDYWHRLFPAIEAARQINSRSILFVQRKDEIEKLVEVIPGAFTGDVRRCMRRLERQGGLFVLLDTQWTHTLAEGLCDDTTVILEKMPEAISNVEGIGPWNDRNDSDEVDSDELSIELEDDAAASIALPRIGVRQPIPDLQELGKMTLWQRTGNKSIFVCLDARLWNEKGNAPFAIMPINCTWHEAIPWEKIEQAGFRQTTGEFSLGDNWEEEVCKWFHVKNLHPFQRTKLARILPRANMPYEYVERATGGGKSLIFQAAALYRGATTGRLTVVISPLRALIHDQVGKLHEKGFALDVEALSGDMSRTDIEDAYRRIAGGETKVVYTAPERFRSKGFLQALETRINLDEGGQPEFWVFDEAHCISLWGLEFRPDYRKAAAYIRKSCERAGMSAAPVLLVSATLTQLAKDDIEKVLGFRR